LWKYKHLPKYNLFNIQKKLIIRKFEFQHVLMKTINIKISELEYNQLGLTKKTISLSELIDIIGKKISKQSLEKSIQLAEKYGLGKMTMEEIDQEIRDHRNAKNNS